MLDCEIQLNSFRFAQSLCPPDSVIVSLKSLNGMQIVVSIGKSQVNHRLLSARNCFCTNFDHATKIKLNKK